MPRSGLFPTLVLADLTIALDGTYWLSQCPRLALDGFRWTWLALVLSWSGLDATGQVWQSPFSRQLIPACTYLKNGGAACVTRTSLPEAGVCSQVLPRDGRRLDAERAYVLPREQPAVLFALFAGVARSRQTFAYLKKQSTLFY